MAEKIFFIFVVGIIVIAVFEFIISVLFDLYIDRYMQSKDFLSDGGPIRNIKYFDKDGNVIYYQKVKYSELDRPKKKKRKRAVPEQELDEEYDDDEITKKIQKFYGTIK